MSDRDFFGKGKCQGMPLSFFFPQGTPGRKAKGAPSETHEDAERENAKFCQGLFCNSLSEDQVLGECPVISECLDYALRNNEQGVLGGTSTGQRAELIKSHS